jgi:hypothetical protein
MSGGGGGVIIIHTVQVLKDPLVYGMLPINTKLLIDPILAKDPSLWTLREKKDLSIAYSWALQNL